MGINDGLGFEEVNQSGTNTTLTQAVSGTFTRLSDATGRVLSDSVGSPAVFGTRVQIGTVLTNAASGGVVEFGTQFASAGYKITLTAGSNGAGKAPYVSGTRNVSGCEMVGEAAVRYDFIAVGL